MTTLRPLDIDTLMNVVHWAELSSTLGHRPPGFESWGVWDQGVYAQDLDEKEMEGKHAENREVCGTAFCIAGQVTWQNNYRMLVDAEGDAEECIKEAPTLQRDDKGHVIWEDVPGARRQDIAETATDLLGITEGEAGWLFDGSNSLRVIKEIINRLCTTRGLPLAYPDSNIYVPDDDDEEGSDW